MNSFAFSLFVWSPRGPVWTVQTRCAFFKNIIQTFYILQFWDATISSLSCQTRTARAVHKLLGNFWATFQIWSNFSPDGLIQLKVTSRLRECPTGKNPTRASFIKSQQNIYQKKAFKTSLLWDKNTIVGSCSFTKCQIPVRRQTTEGFWVHTSKMASQSYSQGINQ